MSLLMHDKLVDTAKPGDRVEVIGIYRAMTVRNRLKVYEMVELKMKGDGNCQFRALSDQLYCSTDYHSYVSQEVVEQLKSFPDLYSGYVSLPYAEYLKRMSKNGEWGDHVTLQAAADTYGVKIFVLTSFKDTCYIEILPRVEKSSRGVCHN